MRLLYSLIFFIFFSINLQSQCVEVVNHGYVIIDDSPYLSDVRWSYTDNLYRQYNTYIVTQESTEPYPGYVGSTSIFFYHTNWETCSIAPLCEPLSLVTVPKPESDCHDSITNYSGGYTGQLAWQSCDSTCYVLEQIAIPCDDILAHDPLKQSCNTDKNYFRYQCDTTNPSFTSYSSSCDPKNQDPFADPCQEIFDAKKIECESQGLVVQGNCKSNGVVVTLNTLTCEVPQDTPPDNYSDPMNDPVTDPTTGETDVALTLHDDMQTLSDNMSGQFDNVNNNLDKIDSTINNLSDKLDTTNNSMAGLRADIDNQSSILSDIKSNTASSNSLLADIKSNTQNTSDKLDTTNNTLSDMKDLLQDIKDKNVSFDINATFTDIPNEDPSLIDDMLSPFATEMEDKINGAIAAQTTNVGISSCGTFHLPNTSSFVIANQSFSFDMSAINNIINNDAQPLFDMMRIMLIMFAVLGAFRALVKSGG